jgi:AcrR family transcriptional regulator
MPTTRQVAKAGTRAKVIEAARVCFGTLGYERATIRDIARKVEMSTGAVFASLSGKIELYSAVYGHPPLTPEQGRQLVAVLKGEAVRPDWLNAMAAADVGDL